MVFRGDVRPNFTKPFLAEAASTAAAAQSWLISSGARARRPSEIEARLPQPIGARGPCRTVQVPRWSLYPSPPATWSASGSLCLVRDRSTLARRETPSSSGTCQPCGACPWKISVDFRNWSAPNVSGLKISTPSATTSSSTIELWQHRAHQPLAGVASWSATCGACRRSYEQPAANRGNAERTSLPVLPRYPADRAKSMWWRRPSGSFLVSTSRTPGVSDDDTRTIHVLKDITDRREAERKYRELFDSIQEGLFFATPDGRFLDVNDAMVRMLGYASREELLRADVSPHLYPAPEVREQFLRALAERGVSEELRRDAAAEGWHAAAHPAEYHGGARRQRAKSRRFAD